MQIVVMLVFLSIWLIVLWSGSIALEWTGMERRKARFQALSALTGTGFTTGEAEAVVNDPRRRRIATWLIFIGNAGIIAFLILVILYVRSGIVGASPLLIGVAAALLLAIAACVRFGVVDRLSNVILGATGARRRSSTHRTRELLHQRGRYAMMLLTLGEEAAGGITLQDTGLLQPGVAVLAVERGDEALPFPGPDQVVGAGDGLLCYADVESMDSVGK